MAVCVVGGIVCSLIYWLLCITCDVSISIVAIASIIVSHDRKIGGHIVRVQVEESS